MKVLVTALIFVLLGSSLWAEEHHHHKSPAAAQYSEEYMAFMRSMGSDMETMMRDMHAQGYSEDTDIDFLAMMIPHHQGAVDMARLQLIYGKDPLTRKLAEEIISSQQVEIEAMKRRLVILRSGKGKAVTEFPALGGTRGEGPATPGKDKPE